MRRLILSSELWTREEAIELCKKIETVLPLYGAHIGLTGGVLYKEGPRKDLDLIIYRIRQEDRIDFTGVLGELDMLGVQHVSSHGFVTKFEYKGKSIDILNPEYSGLAFYPGGGGEPCPSMPSF